MRVLPAAILSHWATPGAARIAYGDVGAVETRAGSVMAPDRFQTLSDVMSMHDPMFGRAGRVSAPVFAATLALRRP